MLPEGVTDAGLEHLRGMTKLEFLEVTDSPITGRGVSVLAKLKDLEALYLINTQIGDDGLESIGQLTRLRSSTSAGAGSPMRA